MSRRSPHTRQNELANRLVAVRRRHRNARHERRDSATPPAARARCDSTIGCSSEAWKRSTSCRRWSSLPERRPRRRRATAPRAAWWFTRRVSRRRSRSMKIVPAPRIRRPTNGQRASSDFATKRAGCCAFSTKMSSHETWFATIRTLPRVARRARPCTRASMFSNASRRAAPALDQRALARRRRRTETRAIVVASPARDMQRDAGRTPRTRERGPAWSCTARTVKQLALPELGSELCRVQRRDALAVDARGSGRRASRSSSSPAATRAARSSPNPSAAPCRTAVPRGTRRRSRSDRRSSAAGTAGTWIVAPSVWMREPSPPSVTTSASTRRAIASSVSPVRSASSCAS